MKMVDYIIPRWTGQGFPNVIYITHTLGLDYIGYKNIDGTSSKRIAALELAEISPVLDDSTLRTYDLRYSLKEPVSWSIPMSVTDIEFEVQVDDSQTAVVLPL